MSPAPLLRAKRLKLGVRWLKLILFQGMTGSAVLLHFES